MKLEHIKSELKIQDWNGILRSNDVNENFDQLCKVVSEIMDKFAPVKQIKIAWRRKYTEPWMTKGLEMASNRCKNYIDSLQEGAGQDERKKYKDYRSTYNKLKRTSMKEYYKTKYMEYSKNTRKLWQVINNIVGKTKHTGRVIPFITIDSVKTYDANKNSQ